MLLIYGGHLFISKITYVCLEYRPKDEQHMQGNQPKRKLLHYIT